MSKPPGRPKSDDPKLSLPIRVRRSILAGFVDTNAARSAIEALVEARYSPGLDSRDQVEIVSIPVPAGAGARFQAIVSSDGPMRMPRAPIGSRLKKPKGK